VGFGSSLVESLTRFDQLDLLEAVLDQDRDPQSFEILVSHVFLSSKNLGRGFYDCVILFSRPVKYP
jgi:hypothetical protein